MEVKLRGAIDLVYDIPTFHVEYVLRNLAYGLVDAGAITREVRGEDAFTASGRP